MPKALAPKELVKVYESGEKVVLAPWDPMVCASLRVIESVLKRECRDLWHE